MVCVLLELIFSILGILVVMAVIPLVSTLTGDYPGAPPFKNQVISGCSSFFRSFLFLNFGGTGIYR